MITNYRPTSTNFAINFVHSLFCISDLSNFSLQYLLRYITSITFSFSPNAKRIMYFTINRKLLICVSLLQFDDYIGEGKEEKEKDLFFL